MEPGAAMPCPETPGPATRSLPVVLLALVIALLAFSLGVVAGGFTDLPSRLPIGSGQTLPLESGATSLPGAVRPPASGPVAVVSTEPVAAPGTVPDVVARLRPSVVTILAAESQGSGVVWSAAVSS